MAVSVRRSLAGHPPMGADFVDVDLVVVVEVIVIFDVVALSCGRKDAEAVP